MADRSLAYQLGRLIRTWSRTHRISPTKRINGRRHEAALGWRKLSCDAAGRRPAYHRTGRGKTRASGKGRSTGANVLLSPERPIGPAGTGKTTLPKVLCGQAESNGAGFFCLHLPARRACAWKRKSGLWCTNNRPISGARKAYDPTRRGTTSRPSRRVDVAQTVIIDESSMLTEEQLAATLDAVDRRVASSWSAIRDSSRRSARPAVCGHRSPLAPTTRSGAVFRPSAPDTPNSPSGGDNRKKTANLVLAEWFSGRAGGPDGDAVWSELKTAADLQHLRTGQLGIQKPSSERTTSRRIED